MTATHDTDPDTPDAKSLRRRLDGIDKRLARLDVLADDVTDLGHTLGELTHRVTALTQATTRKIITGPDRHPHNVESDPDETSDIPEDGQGQEGQPDWLTVTDPDTATAWLADAVAFTTDILARFPHGSLPACWPVHELAVVEVLALHRQWVDAYTSPDPGAVSDLLGRWLPTAVHRLQQATGECGLHRSHQQDGHFYQVPALDADRVALWWVETRGTDPTAAAAFAMTPLT